ncbi:MAG: DUF4397 domain-containing protein [Chloroflexi bacterium]|nr:DUF4397 domain-containing protein [Chloroflexota bacterium]MCC6891383.1 DUF4397 domain-containing protein [Anaerolineae bacterium]
MRKLMGLLVVVVLMMSIFAPVSAAGTATGYVVHGIPGLVVDVYVDGNLFVEDFKPDTIAGPLVGPAGQSGYIVIVPANGDPAKPALAATVSFNAGANVAIVAHLTEAGAPTLSIFDNDFSKTGAGQTRLIVRHTAAAPAVDALFFPGTANELRVGPLANGQQTAAGLPAGSYTAALVPTGTSTAAYGPFSARLGAGKVYVAYAVGSLSGGTFKMLTQEINVGE